MTDVSAGGVLWRGALRDYPWGRPDGLNAWTGGSSGGPEAELWFGTHPGGPSPALATVPTGSDPPATAPLLVKVLAAGRPLSLQIHPSAAAIRAIVQSGGGDVLADDAEKHELLIALEPFDALAGLRDPLQAAAVMRALGLTDVAERLEDGDVGAAITAALEVPLTAADGAPAYDEGLAAMSADEAAVMRKVLAVCREERGLVVAFMMQPHTLQAGDALGVSVGTVHAYVEGLGVEVMTSSDNVLRLGLTPKQIAVDAALTALDATARPALIRAGEGPCYDAAVLPFRVTRLDAPGTIPPGATALCIDGELTAASVHGDLQARAGQAIHVAADEAWSAQCTGTTYVAEPR